MKNNLRVFRNTINIPLILIGLSTLIFGVLLYLVDRPSHQTYFVYKYCANLSLYNTAPNLFVISCNCLPSFIHVFSFILITAGLLNFNDKGCLFICVCWFLIDALFELGQKFKEVSSILVPDWFFQVPFLENTRNYFVSGTFDFNDLAAITLGAGLAYSVSLITIKRRES